MIKHRHVGMYRTVKGVVKRKPLHPIRVRKDMGLLFNKKLNRTIEAFPSVSGEGKNLVAYKNIVEIDRNTGKIIRKEKIKDDLLGYAIGANMRKDGTLTSDGLTRVRVKFEKDLQKDYRPGGFRRIMRYGPIEDKLDKKYWVR